MERAGRDGSRIRLHETKMDVRDISIYICFTLACCVLQFRRLTCLCLPLREHQFDGDALIIPRGIYEALYLGIQNYFIRNKH